MSAINIPNNLIPSEVFLDRVPKVPQGKYAHIIMLRETESFPIFQTDGSLNAVKVRAGFQQDKNVMRIIMFKRKQVAPERLVGRELLRRHGITQADDTNVSEPPYCEYNEQHCQQCPDCVYYGFAIGEAGSEKSKVYVDSAFSVTGYDESHRQFSFNALFEKGNMSQQGRVRESFGEQDHVLPQVFFPAVVTIKDVTWESFAYVLNNVLRTKRYGATGTRTGKMKNRIIGVVFADGEIFSNLKLTQKIYDLLAERKQTDNNPLNADHVLTAMRDALPALLKEDGVHVTRCLMDTQNKTEASKADDKSANPAGKQNNPKQEGNEKPVNVTPGLSKVLQEITAITTDDSELRAFLKKAFSQAKDYYDRVIAKSSGSGKGTKASKKAKKATSADDSDSEASDEQ